MHVVVFGSPKRELRNTHEMVNTFFSVAFFSAVFVVPAVLVITVRRYGFILGVLAFWQLPLFVIWFGREFLNHPDSIGGGIWLLFLGWLLGLIYCLVVFGLKKVTGRAIKAIRQMPRENKLNKILDYNFGPCAERITRSGIASINRFMNTPNIKNYRLCRIVFWSLLISAFGFLIFGNSFVFGILFVLAGVAGILAMFIACPFCGKPVGYRRLSGSIFIRASLLGVWCLHCGKRLFGNRHAAKKSSLDSPERHG